MARGEVEGRVGERAAGEGPVVTGGKAAGRAAGRVAGRAAVGRVAVEVVMVRRHLICALGRVWTKASTDCSLLCRRVGAAVTVGRMG